jgi:hypothetical protein
LAVLALCANELADCAQPAAAQSFLSWLRAEKEVETPMSSRILHLSTEMLPERERFADFRVLVGDRSAN